MLHDNSNCNCDLTLCIYVKHKKLWFAMWRYVLVHPRKRCHRFVWVHERTQHVCMWHADFEEHEHDELVHADKKQQRCVYIRGWLDAEMVTGSSSLYRRILTPALLFVFCPRQSWGLRIIQNFFPTRCPCFVSYPHGTFLPLMYQSPSSTTTTVTSVRLFASSLGL